MENDLRTMKDVLVLEQENHREMRESVNTFNAQIQAFLTVGNKNKFISFFTFSDIYACFTLSTLQAMVQCIPDAGDLSVPTWQPSPQRSIRSHNGRHGHRQGHQCNTLNFTRK
jgi:hypothetical protein